MREDIKTYGILRAIKFAWQRAFRGYDDTFMWDMVLYLNHYFVPAIKEFCRKKLKACYDEKFVKVYEEMLEKIRLWEEAPDEDLYLSPKTNSAMWSYFGKNIKYFWD